MRPQLASLAKKHGDKVVVLKVNVDRQRTLASMAGVRSIPDRRLFIGGRQLERKVGGMSGQALAKMVLKHEEKIVPAQPRPEAAPMLAEGGPLRRLERKVMEVRSDNDLQWPGKEVAAKEATAAGTPAEDPEIKSGTIEPMGKDWLPPGVTKVK